MFKDFHFKRSPGREGPEEEEEPSDYQDPNKPAEDEMPEGLTAEKIQLNTALIYDAVILFSHVMSQHSEIHSEGVFCDDRESIFVNGTSIFNSMKTFPPFKGLSGEIQLDQQGNRENIQLEVLELASDGLKKVGTWNATQGIQSSRGKTVTTTPNDPDVLRNKTLIVLTVIVSFISFSSMN